MKFTIIIEDTGEGHCTVSCDPKITGYQEVTPALESAMHAWNGIVDGMGVRDDLRIEHVLPGEVH